MKLKLVIVRNVMIYPNNLVAGDIVEFDAKDAKDLIKRGVAKKYIEPAPEVEDKKSNKK